MTSALPICLSMAAGSHMAWPISGCSTHTTSSTATTASLLLRATPVRIGRYPLRSQQLARRLPSLTIRAMAGELTPGILKSFDPPAFLSDLTSENLPEWSKLVSDYFESGKAGNDNVTNDKPRPQFFNATNFPVGEDFVTQDVAWTAFPRRISLAASSDRQRWRVADSDREQQDEYCEWSVERRGSKITRVTFTCEAPEYWEYLASVQPDTVLQLYREHVSSEVRMEDLFREGEYLRKNRWNRDTTNGAMHLVQRNNTLGAQVELAAGASIVRLDSEGQPLTDSTELIRCAAYGDERRFSDPFIGASVNALARDGALVTVANPVALYFDSFQPVGFVTPDGTDASTFWKWTRGENGFHVRAVFEVPPEKGYTVGDITISGKGPIRWGAMLADYIQIRLIGLACNIDPANVKPVQGCVAEIVSSSALVKGPSPNKSGKQPQLTRGRGSSDPIEIPDDISDDEQVSEA
eukprot:TRINITY_DN2287_c0_g1_i1.p1 TRINITY_DN2287_c0_g1~~TRINITY_DN2287_c0_g1_i1.p1  ORF type:complete len:466 (+),score=65.30 TRINITY_DN2287_c0_g1_i1:165-1562(+)